MTVLTFFFLLGSIAGLRSLTPPALVCWAAHFGWFDFSATNLAFIGRPWTLTLFTLLALVELVADKLPGTPARTAPVGLSARIVLGGACGVALAISAGTNVPFAAIAGILGALVGTYAGYSIRHALVSGRRLPDFAVALAEDAIAIAGGLLIMSRF